MRRCSQQRTQPDSSLSPRTADRARAALLAHACGDRFGAPLEFVRDASVRTREVRLGHWTDDTHRSLYLGEALVWVDRGEDGLDEGMMPPGDGAWRSGSALWLAVPAAALRWTEDLGLAVENEARIWGDSDSVACLTGALLGAALGEAAIPPEWLRTLPPRGEIAGLADRLVAQSLRRCVG